MLKAQLDLTRILQEADQPLEADSLRELQGNPLFRRILSSLQRRYLEMAIARHSNERGAYEFDAGAAFGASEMLKRIDSVLTEAASKAAQGGEHVT